MPSLRLRLFNPVVRALIKRKDWGPDDFALARRARRLFGAPRTWQYLASRSVKISAVSDRAVSGEWIEPERKTTDAVLFYIHGGGYVSCSPATHRPVTAALAKAAGMRVFCPDYRLSPEHRLPAALDDVSAAYDWLASKVPASRIAVGGDSAGGGMALSLTLGLRNAGARLPACAVCFSPWTDMTASGDSVRENASADRMFYPETIRQFAAACLPPGADPTSPAFSPVFAEFGGLPPVLFEVGATEVLLDDSRRVHRNILAAGGTSELKIYDGVFHGWQMAAGLIPEADAAIRLAAQFITRHTFG